MPDQPSMMALLRGPVVPLHPDLQPYYEPGPPWPMLRHPLVYSIMHAPEQNRYVNAQYEQKKRQLDDARRRCDYQQLIWLHERPYRVEALDKVARNLDDGLYWELVRSVWVDAENIWQEQPTWRRLLSARRRLRKSAWMDDDRAFFAATLRADKDRIRAWRGSATDEASPGFSWTTDRAKAVWFARRYSRGEAWLLSANVTAANVLFAISDRGESELVVRPRSLHDRTSELLPPKVKASDGPD